MKSTAKSSPNIIPTKAIPYDSYMKMVVDVVANDYLLKNNDFKNINDVIYRIEDLTKDSPFYHPPKLDTARGHIRTFLRIKKNIILNVSNYRNLYDWCFDLVDGSLQSEKGLRLNRIILVTKDLSVFFIWNFLSAIFTFKKLFDVFVKAHCHI